MSDDAEKFLTETKAAIDDAWTSAMRCLGRESCFKCDVVHAGSHPWCQSCRDRVNAQYELERTEQPEP